MSLLADSEDAAVTVCKKGLQRQLFCGRMKRRKRQKKAEEKMTEKKHRKKQNGKEKSRGAAVCAFLGTFLLVALVLVCIPLTVPRLFGYHIYTVISGSMEPAIPTGSLVYIKEMEPENVEPKEVIAFYGAKDSAGIVTHRVVENRVLMGEFVTKGDANQTEDMNPVPYDNFIGKVEFSFPELGATAQILTGKEGKFLAAGVIAAALVLQVMASALEKRFERKRKESGTAAG